MISYNINLEIKQTLNYKISSCGHKQRLCVVENVIGAPEKRYVYQA